jgi:hypothetical protein
MCDMGEMSAWMHVVELCACGCVKSGKEGNAGVLALDTLARGKRFTARPIRMVICDCAIPVIRHSLEANGTGA